MSAGGPGRAVVIGASGGIGRAMMELLQGRGRYSDVVGFARDGARQIDVTCEDSVAAAAAEALSGAPLRLVFLATGFLHDDARTPEKSWRELDAAHLQQAFLVNAVGPALVMKHFLPLLPREGRSVFAALSARVGSIADNRLGGWHSYRASKAALNQLLRTCAIELKRTRPEAICVALHPGTVATRLSEPFAKTGLEVQTPSEVARRLLAVMDGLEIQDSGGFFDHRGAKVPW